MLLLRCLQFTIDGHALTSILQTMQSTKHAKTESSSSSGDDKKKQPQVMTTEETARPLNARELSLYRRVIWRSTMSPTLKSLAIAADTSALRARLMLEHIRQLEAAAHKSEEIFLARGR